MMIMITPLGPGVRGLGDKDSPLTSGPTGRKGSVGKMTMIMMTMSTYPMLTLVVSPSLCTLRRLAPSSENSTPAFLVRRWGILMMAPLSDILLIVRGATWAWLR